MEKKLQPGNEYYQWLLNFCLGKFRSSSESWKNSGSRMLNINFNPGLA